MRLDQRPGRRQLRRAQLLAGAFYEFLHPELLWPLVWFVEILRVPAEPRGRPQFAPTADLVGGAAEELRIDESLDERDPVPPTRQPVVRQACEHAGEQPTREIWIVRFGQNEKTRVIDHQRQAAATLLGRPADELIAVAQMIRRRAETDHGEPLASVSGRVT